MSGNSWIDDYRYDDWKTSPPEDEEPESLCHCAKCGRELVFEEDYWNFEGDILCEDCKDDFVEDHRAYVTGDMAYGV